jgi:hypothetical protein
MSHSCRPRVSETEMRRIFCNVITAAHDAGTLTITEDFGRHVIMLSFAIDKLRRTRGDVDGDLTGRLYKLGYEAGAAIGLSAEAVTQLMEDR